MDREMEVGLRFGDDYVELVRLWGTHMVAGCYVGGAVEASVR